MNPLTRIWFTKVTALSRHGFATEELVMVLRLQWMIRSSGRRIWHLSKSVYGKPVSAKSQRK